MAPRVALALVLTAIGLAGLLLIPPLVDDDGEQRIARYAVDAPASRCPSGTTPAAVLCEVNAVRRAAGLRPIRPAGSLRLAAQLHSDDMVRRRYFSHVSPSGLTLRERVKRAGYLRGVRRPRLGENIAWGSGGAASPAAIVKAWMLSPPHRAIILAPVFRDTGIGITARSPQGGAGATYVLDVGRRR